MRLEVTVQAVGEDGVAHWGYSHLEVFVFSGSDEEDAARMVGALLDRTDEAARSIAGQAGQDAMLRRAALAEEGEHGQGS